MDWWMWIALAAVPWLHGYSQGRKRTTRDVTDAVGLIGRMFAGK